MEYPLLLDATQYHFSTVAWLLHWITWIVTGVTSSDMEYPGEHPLLLDATQYHFSTVAWLLHWITWIVTGVIPSAIA
jgi:cytochrome b561